MSDEAKIRSPFPLPWLTDMPFLRNRTWRRIVLRCRHLVSLAAVWPRSRAHAAWKTVAGSRHWTRYHHHPGTVPGGRCLLDATKVDDRILSELEELRSLWLAAPMDGRLKKYREASRDRALRDIDSVANAVRDGIDLYRVRFFLNTEGRIDHHPWRYAVFVDPDARTIVAPGSEDAEDGEGESGASAVDFMGRP